MEDGNDLTGPYQQHTQLQSQNAIIGDFRRRMEAGEPAVEATGATQPSAPALQPSSGAPLRITIRPQQKVTPPREGSAVGSFVGDVLGGFSESPSAVAAGVNDAVRNTTTGLRNLADWLGTTRIGQFGEIPFPNTGNETLDKIIQRPLSALTDALPEKPSEQKTVTGQAVRDASRFLTGFVPAMRAFGAAGMGGAVGAIGAGAASDFATLDPAEKSLADLIQSHPKLANPVTEFLSSEPTDNEAGIRLKKAVEGAGFGAATEGIIRGVRALGAARRAKSDIELQQQRYGAVPEKEATVLGDPAAPLVSVRKIGQSVEQTETGVPDQVAARGVAGSAQDAKLGAKVSDVTDKSVYINFGRMQTADDVNQVIKDTAKAFKGEIDEARRGVQTNAETKKLADNLGMSVDDLLARREGQPLSAEESLAARRLWATSAEKLLETAQAAAGPNAGAVDLYNFRKMLAVHHAIQSEVIAARTETARALQAWSIPAGGGNVERARQIEALLENSGGSAVSSELAKRIATLGSDGLGAAALSTVVKRGWLATSMDMVKEAYTLGLLWNPATHAVNAASNLAVSFQQIYERGFAAKIGDFLGSSVDARVADGEALAMAYGLISSLRESFTLAGRALRKGESSGLAGKVDRPNEPAISSGSVSRELQYNAADAQAFAETPLGRGIDFIGEAGRVPGRLLMAGDEFFKSGAYRMEVHAQALRQATQEGRSGPDLYRRMAEIANDPPESIRLSAADAALYATFQRKPGEWAQALMRMREAGSMNPTFMILPFIKTPANILSYTFERSPLAPLVGQWRDDIAAGGVRRDLALARMASGTAVLATSMDLASSGIITGAGPANQAQKEALMRQGWQPYSVYAGSKYYSYNRLDPFGMVLGFAGTVAEKMKAKDSSPEDFDEWNEVLAEGIGAVSASIVDKTYFKGVTDFLSMIHESQRGEGGVTNYVNKQTGSLLPFSSAFTTVNRFVDPTQREINSPWDAVQAKIVGLSSTLPPARDVWGKERAPQEVYGRVFDAISPVAVREDVNSPVDTELERLGGGVDRIKKKGAFQGAEVNFREFPDVYDEYVRLAGNELKHPVWGLGAKDFLDQVVTGRNSMSEIYKMKSDGPEGEKLAFIRSTVSEYRRLAQQQIMDETNRSRWPDFAAYVEARAAQKQQLKMPVQ